MSNISLDAFAAYYKVTSLGGLAEIAKKWPSTSPVHMEAVLQVIGLPLAPTEPSPQDPAPATSFTMTWKDPGANSPLAATSWNWQLTERLSETPSVIRQGSVQTPQASTGTLTGYGTEFGFTVTAVNQFGKGPSSLTSYVQTPYGAGSGTPTITASIASDGTVTVSGTQFNKSNTVYIQATVTGGPNTPTLEATNASDLRTQVVTANAGSSGVFTTKVAPQGFQAAIFSNGVVAYLLAGETIAVVAANNGVGDYQPGSGVSNTVTETVPEAISA